MKAPERQDRQKKKRKSRPEAGRRLFLTAALLSGFVLLLGGCADAGANGRQQEARVREMQQLLTEAGRLHEGYFYEEAEAKLLSRPELFAPPRAEEEKDGKKARSTGGSGKEDREKPGDGGAGEKESKTALPEDEGGLREAMERLLEEIRTDKASLVKYEGPVHHVFFHSLILYPELAFDNIGHSPQGYNMWMTTAGEFKKMLPQLRERGYVLYPLDQIIEMEDGTPATPENAGGAVRRKDIYLPPGKIPLFLSVDDVNYYDYMKPDGFANRLVLGKDGRVWTEVITPEGETVQTRDGDVMPILDDFVAEHPDFSWRGAKGVIAVTGYQGALGYRITDDLPGTEEMQRQVKAISDTLRAGGWLFACHSHTHNSYFRTRTVTMSQMIWDVTEWKTRIEPWVGRTNIYISPFGYLLPDQDPRYRYIIGSGFNIFCPVGSSRNVTVYRDNLVMPRVNLDGFSMLRRPDEMNRYYFDVETVLDPERPPLVP